MPDRSRGLMPATRAFVSEQLESSDSSTLATLARLTGEAFHGITGRPTPSSGRHAIEVSQRRDPLAKVVDLPLIDIVIPCHPKDVDTLPLSLAGARASSRNPIGRIRLVAPAGFIAELGGRFPGVTLETESDLLGESLLVAVDEFVPTSRRGWAIQQLIKLTAALTSSTAGSLVIDADTVLLEQRTWLSPDGTQLLSFSHDYHMPYLIHADRMWGRQVAATGMSYVSHHQLMQQDLIAAMFPDPDVAFRRWIELADWTESLSALADYYCYGAWVRRNAPKRLSYAKLLNRGSTRSALPPAGIGDDRRLTELRNKFPGALSVSFHSYLEPRPPAPAS